MSKLAKIILALIIYLLPSTAMAQGKSVKGKITDETGIACAK
ncbi:MAG: hypothetical protein ABIN74_03195 [Ferruginibacter sp.]